VQASPCSPLTGPDQDPYGGDIPAKKRYKMYCYATNQNSSSGIKDIT